jgi:ribulose-phosphate 3-epimerase
MVEVSTSLLSVKKEEIVKKIYCLEVAHTDYFHIDVMDGKFVKNDTRELMLEYANTIKQISNIPLDIHLMVENIKENIDEYISLQPNIITFQIEACKNKEETFEIIDYIKRNNIKVGIAIKPDTRLEEIFDYLPYIHVLLVMTVEPGLGGQDLIAETIEKVENLKRYIDENNIEIDIEVDGGINNKNAQVLKEKGANVLVSGTYIVGSENYENSIKELKNI